jgi:hypothetical protein
LEAYAYRALQLGKQTVSFTHGPNALDLLVKNVASRFQEGEPTELIAVG